MTRDEVLRAVGEVAREHVGFAGRLAPEMRLVEDLGLDSIRLLTLAVEVENRFQVCLDEEDEEGITTVGDLVVAVERKLSSSGRPGPAGGTDPPGDGARGPDA